MNNLKIYCWVKIIVALLVIAIFATACYDNDDFTPYTHYSEALEETLSVAEIHSLSDVVPDANKIAEKHAPEILLTRIILETADAGLTGNIKFLYAKAKDNKNQITAVEVSFDIGSKTFYNLDYEEGHGKRVDAVLEQISDKYIDMSIEDLLEIIESEKNIPSESVKIDLSFERLEAYSYQEK